MISFSWRLLFLANGLGHFLSRRELGNINGKMARQLMDIFIYLSQHTVLAFIGFLVLWGLGNRFFRADDRICRVTAGFGQRGLVLFAAGLFLTYLAISGWYLGLDGFAGEVEPMVTSLSWMVQDGHPLYHGLDSPTRYSVLYGPSVFLTNGLFLKILGPSLFSTKLASALAGLATLLLLHGSVARKWSDPVGLMVVGLAVLYFWCQGFAVYLVRPDSLLLFSVSLALYCALKVHRLLAMLAVGAMLGFAINLKVHAGLYFLPILTIIQSRFGWKSLLLVAGIAFVVTWAPFALHSQISLANYLVWLKNAMGHGLGLTTALETSRFVLVLILPMVVLLILNPNAKAWIRRHLVLLGSMLVSLVGVWVLSAKPGAGLVHLLPLVPVALYIDALMVIDLPDGIWVRPHLGSRRIQLGRGAALAAMMTVILAGMVHEYRVCKLVQWENQDTRALMGDIAQIQDTYPGLSMGMAVGGEGRWFRATWMRPLLVFNNHPLLLDPIAVMDCHLSGRAIPTETFAALASGQIAVWLVPKAQKPFAKTNWYAPHEPIFSDAFMDHFKANYSARVQSEFFDLWIWNGLSGDGLSKPALASLKSGRISS